MVLKKTPQFLLFSMEKGGSSAQCMEEDGATILLKSGSNLSDFGRVCHLVYVMVAIPWKGFPGFVICGPRYAAILGWLFCAVQASAAEY